MSIGQVVDYVPTELMSYNFALEQAEKNNDSSSVEALKKIGAPSNGLYANGINGLLTQRKILMKKGGVFYNKNKIYHLIKLLLTSPEYTLSQKVLSTKGRNQSLKAIWNSDLMKTNFIKTLPIISVPVYFFQGRMD